MFRVNWRLSDYPSCGVVQLACSGVEVSKLTCHRSYFSGSCGEALVTSQSRWTCSENSSHSPTLQPPHHPCRFLFQEGDSECGGRKICLRMVVDDGDGVCLALFFLPPHLEARMPSLESSGRESGRCWPTWSSGTQ